jgi:hypothetical protein
MKEILIGFAMAVIAIFIVGPALFVAFLWWMNHVVGPLVNWAGGHP